MGQEIDLTRYVAILLRKWWLILLMAVLCVGGAVLATVMLPRVYQASALVATVRERTDVRFSSEIRTLTEYDLRPSVNDRQRMATFVKLVPNPVIAQQVIELLGDRLPQEYRNVDTLLGMVSGIVVPDSDTIEITARCADPDVPVELVNAWADVYVDTVNQTYGSLDQATMLAISAQVKQAQASYASAQAALEQAFAVNQVARLQRDLDQYQMALNGLVQDSTLTLQRLLADRQRTAWLLRSAEDMRTQITAARDKASQSSVQALALLQTQVYGLDVPSFAEREPLTIRRTTEDMDDSMTSTGRVGGEQLQFHIHTAESESGAMLTSDDLLVSCDALVQILQDRLLNIDQQITAALISNIEADSGTETTITALQDQERMTRMLIAQESAKLSDATMQRDMARDAYEALARKEAEMVVSAETTGAQVRMALSAWSSRLPQTSRIRTLGMAALAGLVLGTLTALITEFWQDYRRREMAAPSRQA